MDFILSLLFIYLVVINIISIFVTVSDKKRSIKKKWRIKESTLLLLSLSGGSIGMYITMHIIRHKTKHLKFMLGIPVIIILQVLLIYFIWRYLCLIN